MDNINDAVTANLDLAGLMEDYLSQMTPDECEIAFEVLRSLTVCDPTCGSGAFLLSALDVLEPMYTVVLDRAREIADSVARGPAGWSHVPQFLAEGREPPQRSVLAAEDDLSQQPVRRGPDGRGRGDRQAQTLPEAGGPAGRRGTRSSRCRTWTSTSSRGISSSGSPIWLTPTVVLG